MTRTFLAAATAAAAVAAALGALAGSAAAPALAAELLIEVRGVRSDAGRIYVAVHAPREGEEFPYAEGMVAAIHQQARSGDLRFVLRDLPAGRYAVNAFHDENDNGDLDTNVLGIPKEGYGFANDPSTTFGPPDFDEAAVAVGEAPATAAMTLSY